MVAMVIQQQRCRHWLRLPNGKARMSHLGLLLAGMKVTVTMSTEWQPCAQPGWVNPSPSSHLLPVTPPKTSLPYLQPTDQERAFVSPPHSLWTRGGGGTQLRETWGDRVPSICGSAASTDPQRLSSVEKPFPATLFRPRDSLLNVLAFMLFSARRVRWESEARL